MTVSAIGDAKIEPKTEAVSEAEGTAIIKKEVKKRGDSVDQYTQGGRPELAEKEAKEIAVLETFLPQPLTPGELEQLVKETIAETGATSKKDMGKVIKAVQSKTAGRAEGKAISERVSRLLP